LQGNGVSKIVSSKPFTVDATKDYTAPDSPNGVGIVLGDRTEIRNCTLESQTAKGQESALVGFDARIATPVTARLTNVTCNGSEWCVYVWPSGEPEARLQIEDCTLRGGRQCLSACGSNRRSQFVHAIRTKFYVQPDRVKAGGSISQGSYAVVARGGEVVLTACQGYVYAADTVAKQAAFFCGTYAGTGEYVGKVEIHNCYSMVHSLPGVDSRDVIAGKAPVKIKGGYGSGVNGEWTQN